MRASSSRSGFTLSASRENCILLTVQTLFIVLQLPGWKIAQAVCILLLLLLNRKPLLDGAGKIVRFRR